MRWPLPLRMAATGVLVAGVIAEASDAKGDKVDAPDQRRDEEREGTGPQLIGQHKKFNWREDDEIDFFYAEFLLASWVLEHAPWNAFHSALAFQNKRTGEKNIFDYSPEDTSSVTNMVIPEVQMNFALRPYLTGDFNFKWRDGAKTQYYDHWPKEYTNTVRLGTLNGSVFNTYARWVEEGYAPMFHAFQPVEVAVRGKGSVQRSRMCHDFVTDSLWVLYEEGVEFIETDPIFRDHIIMYATDLEKVTDFAQTPRGKRQWLRYLRGLWIYLEQIKEQFTHARHALAVAWKLGLPIFLHNEGHDWKVQLVPPFLNYCYLPLAMPPEVHDPFMKWKLCALGMDAQTDNITTPFPEGTILAVEERLDRLEALIAVVLVALFAVLCAGASGAGPADT